LILVEDEDHIPAKPPCVENLGTMWNLEINLAIYFCNEIIYLIKLIQKYK
jgi:hypothetical protein